MAGVSVDPSDESGSGQVQRLRMGAAAWSQRSGENERDLHALRGCRGKRVRCAPGEKSGPVTDQTDEEVQQMSKRNFRAIAVAAVTLAIVAMVPGRAEAEPFRIGHSIWVGYGPFFIAEENGYFADEGVDVELVNIEDVKVRFTALSSGRIDALATTADTMPIYVKPDLRFQFLFAVDKSVGGDGIVADESIQSVADLEGKRIAFNEGSVSQFYLGVLLREAGLSLDSIEHVQMSPGDAGSAFVAGQVDAAVTWEPWLSRGEQAPHGHILADTSTRPGLVSDLVLSEQSVIEERRPEIEAVYRAWVRAVDFIAEDPESAYRIMAEGVGGWLQDPEQFKAVLEKVEYYGGEGNREYFGTPENPGALKDTVSEALVVWRKLDRLQVDLTAEDLINYQIVNSQ